MHSAALDFESTYKALRCNVKRIISQHEHSCEAKVWHVSEAPHDSGDDGRGKVQVQHLTRWCSSGGALTIAAQGSSLHVHHWVISQSWSTGTWTSLLHGGEGGFREYNTEPKHDILQKSDIQSYGERYMIMPMNQWENAKFCDIQFGL